MKFVNPIEVLLTDPRRKKPHPAGVELKPRGMVRMGDPTPAVPEVDPNTVFIAADTLLHAEETARELGLKPGEWRALLNAEDLHWYHPGHGAKIIEAGCAAGLSKQIHEDCD